MPKFGQDGQMYDDDLGVGGEGSLGVGKVAGGPAQDGEGRLRASLWRRWGQVQGL